MNKKILVILAFFAALSLGGCHSIYKKQQSTGELNGIDTSSFDPDEIFVYQDTLYLVYQDPRNNDSFYLTVTFHKQESRKNKQNSNLIASIAKENLNIPRDKREEILLVKDILPQAIEKVVYDTVPEQNNTGVMLLTALRDMVLYRDAEGKIRLSEPAQMPDDVSVIGRKGKKYLRRNVYDNIRSLLKEKYPDKEKFVLDVKGISLIPYIYVDTGKNIAAAIELPDFYEVRKDISTIGFSTDILYSFFIKSHIFAIIKAPFTSLHRLFSTATYSVFAGLSPRIEDLKEIPPLNKSGEMMDIKAFEKVLDFNISDEKYKGRAKILIDGDAFFPDFIEKAKIADKSIDVRVYIFKTDPYSLTLADLLRSKSNEGVKVRVLTDEINTVLNWTKDPEQIYSRDYVMPSIKKYLKDSSEVKFRTILNTWANVDHRKAIIIDSNLAYMGGMNFGEEYRYFWHDMMLLLEGPVVAKLEEDFNQTWTFAGAGGDFAAAGRAVFERSPDYTKGVEPDMFDMRPLYTKPTSAEIFNAQIEAIKRAKSRVYIENPYFSDVRIIQELINARGRGVDVRIILPMDNDVGMMSGNNMVKANILFKNGITVYFYPRMSHIKAGIFDNWACVGSANFDKLSLYISNEMNFGISDPGFVEALHTQLFQKDFEESEIMDKELELKPGDYIMSTLAAQG